MSKKAFGPPFRRMKMSEGKLFFPQINVSDEKWERIFGKKEPPLKRALELHLYNGETKMMEIWIEGRMVDSYPYTSKEDLV